MGRAQARVGTAHGAAPHLPVRQLTLRTRARIFGMPAA